MSYTALQQNHVTLQSPHITITSHFTITLFALQLNIAPSHINVTTVRFYIKVSRIKFSLNPQSVHGKTYKHHLYCKHGNWTHTAAGTSYVLLSFTHTFHYISDKLHLPTNKK